MSKNKTQLKGILSKEQLQKIHPLTKLVSSEKKGEKEIFEYTIKRGAEDVSFIIVNNRKKNVFSIEFGTIVFCFKTEFPFSYSEEMYGEFIVPLIKRSVRSVVSMLGIENPYSTK